MSGFHFSSILCWETLSNANACLNAKRYVHMALCQNPKMPEGNYLDQCQDKHCQEYDATVQSQVYQYQAAEPAMTVNTRLL